MGESVRKRTFQSGDVARASAGCQNVQNIQKLTMSTITATRARQNFAELIERAIAGEETAIERHGPFELSGDPAIMRAMDELLADFVDQQRMKLPGSVYTPCYRIAGA